MNSAPAAAPRTLLGTAGGVFDIVVVEPLARSTGHQSWFAGNLSAALTAAGVVFRGEVYPARHGWAVADSPAYDRDAAERHWTALLDHLAAAFPHRGSRRDDPARVMSGTGKATVRTGKSG